MRGEPGARWRTVFPFDAAEVRVNEDAGPSVTDQVEVSRGGQRARLLSFPPLTPIATTASASSSASTSGVLVTERVTPAALCSRRSRRDDRLMICRDMAERK